MRQLFIIADQWDNMTELEKTWLTLRVIMMTSPALLEVLEFSFWLLITVWCWLQLGGIN